MNHYFKAVIICYFCQHLLWRLKVTFPPRVNVIVLNICCLWAILELFKRRTATSGQGCLGFTVRKWLISKTSCLFVCMLLDYRKFCWTEHFWRNFSCLSGSFFFSFLNGWHVICLPHIVRWAAAVLSTRIIFCLLRGRNQILSDSSWAAFDFQLVRQLKTVCPRGWLLSF